MNRLRQAIIIALLLLALAAGAAKFMKMPQELETFGPSLGLSATGVAVFGGVQMLAGLLLAFARTRLAGALMLDVALLASTAALFIVGDLSMAALSLVPVALNSLLIIDLMMQKVRSQSSE